MTLKVVHATAWYPPYTTGGTETYLEGLITALRRRRVAGDVLLPRHDGATEAFEWNGASVTTYPSRRAVGTGESLCAYGEHLRVRAGAIYHQHSWTPDCGGEHLRLAKKAGMATVLTIHTPNNICLRGTMMRFGRTPCDGKVRIGECAACWAEGRGAPKGLARLLALWPSWLRLGRGRFGTALSGRRLAVRRRREVAAMLHHADHVVAVCAWLHSALLSNGAEPARLSLSRQGLSEDFLARLSPAPGRRPGPLRLLYLGRWDPVKGLHVAVRALAQNPDLDVRLSIHGAGETVEGLAYRRHIEAIANGDARIRIEAPLGRKALPAAMADADVLLAPSLWLETGPMVVLEAQAAGLFVLGSALGGIAELVDHPLKGRLVPPDDPRALGRAIRDLVDAPPTRRAWPVRTADDCARDMIGIYDALASANPS